LIDIYYRYSYCRGTLYCSNGTIDDRGDECRWDWLIFFLPGQNSWLESKNIYLKDCVIVGFVQNIMPGCKNLEKIWRC